MTECVISINLIDPTAKQDSSISVTNNTVNGNPENLKLEELAVPEYMTCEWNYSILNGAMQHMPNNIQDAKYSLYSQMSGSDRIIANEPTMTISFANVHSSAGLTFNFSNEYPEKIRVVWYSSSNFILSDMIFYPDSNSFICENKVENYKKIVVFFTNTVFPYRAIKLIGISYGSELNYSADSVVKANLLEELDPISSEISINTCNFTLFDASKDFNILNPGGKYSLLQTQQEIIVKEKKDSIYINMGTFYLNTWKSEDETQISFETFDAIGILDQTDFKDGRIYVNELAGNIIDDIMASAGWTKYTVSSEVRETVLSGYIPICTHREALQHVAFATRAVCDCSRSNKVNIYRSETTADTRVSESRIFLASNRISVKKYVSGVNITMHSYSISPDTKTVFEGTITAGNSEILFSNPCTNLSIAGGTIIESGVNYAIVHMEMTGECTITGNEYTDTTSTFVKSIDNINTGEINNTVSIKDATLVSKNNAYLVSIHVLDYYQNRKVVEQKIILDNERVGRWINTKSQYNMWVSGAVESQNIDLAGGFISEVKVVGFNTIETDLYFTGIERFTGEEIGVI